MKKQDIILWDWERILFGQAPPEFLLEVLVRTVVVYFILLIVIRLLGKRMDGQISLTEMAVMITLGAVISVPMQTPDRGLLVGFVALACVFFFERGLNWLTVKKEKVEALTQGSYSILVEDGVLQMKAMRKAGISQQNVFAVLRSKNIMKLSKVKRLYFEACGLMNVFEEENDRPGLSILPATETEFVRHRSKANDFKIACKTCGFVKDTKPGNVSCSNCGEVNWGEAI